VFDIETFRNYCLAKKAVTEEFPFDEEVLVFKVAGKIFALTSIYEFKSINLKCDPVRAIELREQYEAIIPGFHMNKKHWNTVQLDSNVPLKLIKEMIDDSYNLVVETLSKREQLKVKSK
jgi:predicted DNA-binding protein (MmcQ/YjbR family)